MNKIENETLLELMNHLFEHLNINLLLLTSLSDEFLIRKLILDLEPDFEQIIGKLDIVNDGSFAIRYSNMVLLINSLDSYLEKCYEKSKLSSKVPLKKLILINDLLKGEEYQIIALIEILILISSLSSKKDFFLDKIGECDEKLINIYISYVEKYVPLESKNDGNESLININTSLIKYNNFEGSSKILAVLNEKLNKKIEESEKEKQIFLKTVNELENRLNDEKRKNKALEQKIIDQESRFKDFSREIEIVKTSNNINKIQQQEFIEETMMISQYKSELRIKEIEIEDKIREIQQINNFHSDEVKRLTEKIDLMQEKISNSEELASEYDKLKIKLKDLQYFKDKQSELDDLTLNLESKNRIIDSLIQEKQSLTSQLEKYSREILNEKEKVRKKEYELKQIKVDLEDMKKDYLKRENQLKNANNASVIFFIRIMIVTLI